MLRVLKGEVMGTSSKSDSDSARSSIDAVRQAWLEAIRAADVERLATLVTDDVVVIHGTGRCVRGRDELKMDLRNAFKAFSVEQSASRAGLIVRGSWALETADVETKLTPRTGGEPTVFHSTTVTALERQSDGSWKVGRVLGVLDSPLPGAKGLLAKVMSAEYRIVAAGSQFTALDAAGVHVGIYPTEEAAGQGVERRRKQDAKLETAKLLLDTAAKAHMQIHGVDRETALYWIRSASEVK
jgi:uncharacterized protein (TIGR02246 family)